MLRSVAFSAAMSVCVAATFFVAHGDDVDPNGRRPGDDREMRRWLKNAIGHHGFSVEETADALGLTTAKITEAAERFDIQRGIQPSSDDRLFILPYPGGRHPRIGFLDGAVDPQRETKVSVFTPWHDPATGQFDYVVVDCPEAIWSNLGLTYLAHTHVPTIWTDQGVDMDRLEWESMPDGSLKHERKLPNGISFTSQVTPKTDHVRMQMTLTNGTDETLTGMRVQMCVMLKGATGFTEQSNDNKTMLAPYAAVHDTTGMRWMITAWKPNQRTWANPKCPCLHSDPQFPDAAPGETQKIEGWLSFYEGADVQAEIDRIEALHWWTTENE